MFLRSPKLKGGKQAAAKAEKEEREKAPPLVVSSAKAIITRVNVLT